MTGYATVSGETDRLTWDWEARSVNGKGLDLRLRLPEGCESLEPAIRRAAGAGLKRGNVTASLRVKTTASARVPATDPPALAAAIALLGSVEERAAEADVALRPSSAAEVLAMPGVIIAGDAQALPLPAIAAGIEPLFAALAAMRAEEGAQLGTVLADQLAGAAALLDRARTTAEARAARAGDLLKTRVDALLAATDAADPARLQQELAILAVKADVTEELDRLTAHVEATRQLLAEGGPVGRKLDFLMQEYMREANTLCSKSQSADLTQIGLDLKVLIDQMREQVQNLE